jgi:hypothetical protein
MKHHGAGEVMEWRPESALDQGLETQIAPPEQSLQMGVKQAPNQD